MWKHRLYGEINRDLTFDYLVSKALEPRSTDCYDKRPLGRFGFANKRKIGTYIPNRKNCTGNTNGSNKTSRNNKGFKNSNRSGEMKKILPSMTSIPTISAVNHKDISGQSSTTYEQTVHQILHSQYTEDVIYCGACHQRFCSLYTLLQHKETCFTEDMASSKCFSCADDGLEEKVCSFCDYAVPTAWTLLKHLQSEHQLPLCAQLPFNAEDSN